MRILIGYASRFGSTRDIAMRIAGTVRTHGSSVDVRSVDEISEFEQTLHPRDYRVFAGVIDLDHWPAWGRLLFKALGGHAGDNRQWPDIDAWAEEISREI
jgi:hypothetical protein